MRNRTNRKAHVRCIYIDISTMEGQSRTNKSEGKKREKRGWLAAVKRKGCAVEQSSACRGAVQQRRTNTKHNLAPTHVRWKKYICISL